MSRSLNKAILIGNLGSDPEIRTIPSGARVAQFSLATSRRWTDKNGQQQEKTEWHRIVVWDRLVDVVEKWVHKGDRLYVEGEIEYRQYQDKDGVTKYMTEIRAREIMMLSGRGEGGDADRGGGFDRGRSAAPARAAAPARGNDYDDFQAPPLEDEDDLPF
ncbi:MAG TPA: single-stranded DNA-binding protein [Longimicrobium sp.]